jgi:hypothetical protein
LQDVLSRGLALERAIQVALAFTIVASVLGAGSVLRLIDFGRTARWVGLATLLVLALVFAVRRAPLGLPRGLLQIAAAALFLGLAWISAVWSASPVLTLERAAAFSAVVVAAAALGAGSAGSTASIRHFVAGVLWGVGAVAAGGLAVLAVDSDRAIDPATINTAARFQGLGGGPNTATMVLAIGTPLAVDAFLRTRRRSLRLVAAAVAAAIIASILASGSRGALVSAFAGLAAYGLLRERGHRRRLLAGVAVAVAFVFGVALMEIPDPLPPGSTASARGYIPPYPSPAPIVPRKPYGDANYLLRLQDDVGHPPPGEADTRRRVRTLFGSSGRAQAWEGALQQGSERPLTGYGFGTESRVFVDRYVSFNSGVPENSYIGLFLQLGAAGIAVFGALAVAILATAARAIGRLEAPRRELAAACTGAFVAGLVLALFQSYIYAAGNNATAVLWICAFLAGAAAIPDAEQRGR